MGHKQLSLKTLLHCTTKLLLFVLILGLSSVQLITYRMQKMNSENRSGSKPQCLVSFPGCVGVRPGNEAKGT